MSANTLDQCKIFVAISVHTCIERMQHKFEAIDNVMGMVYTVFLLNFISKIFHYISYNSLFYLYFPYPIYPMSVTDFSF